jgi:pimeloyl-ACP methyl ester carboxylesterase
MSTPEVGGGSPYRRNVASWFSRSVTVNHHHALAQKRTPHLTAEALASIEVPVLVIPGSDDPVFPIQHAKWSASIIPTATLRVIDAIGHALDPAFFDVIVDALRGFYSRGAEISSTSL